MTTSLLDDILTSATTFPRADTATWRALVDKALKGASFERRLVTRTVDGIAIEPLYTRAAGEIDPGAPGAPPYTRGPRAAVTGLGWDILAAVDHGDPAAANRVVREELEGGANGVVLVLAGPGQAGIGAADWGVLLAGVHLDLATVALRPGSSGPAAVHGLAAALPALDGTPGRRRIAADLDPIGTFARHGTVGGPVEAAVAAAVAAARALRAVEPAARTLLADGTIAHEAGASEAQEVAAVAATVLAYLRALEAAGTPPEDALPQIAVAAAADADMAMTTAKVRALRTVVHRVAAACGAGHAAGQVHVTVATSARMMARRDPWTNMLRTTVATVGAAFGGADAILTLPFTHALGLADGFARRIARNTQIVAQEESGLGRVVDPAGGAWYIEQLTAALAEAAWAEMQRIEREGGIVTSLRRGLLQERIATVEAQRAAAIATGRLELTGVSAFPRLGDDGVQVTPRPPAPPLATPAEARPLAPIRLAAPFEAVRERADAAPRRPTVMLASLGTAADHTARSTYVRNLLAAGGIDVVGGGDHASVDAVVAAYRDAGTPVAVIASSDTVYADMAAAAARALRAAGAVHVALAGRPGEAEAAYRAAGIDRFVQAGQDQIATLEAIHDLLGTPRTAGERTVAEGPP